MTSVSIRIAIVGVAFYLAATATTAEAAKGVKKVGQSNQARTVTGEVMNVQHKNGVGSFFLRTAHHHKKNGAAGGANAGNAAGGKRHHHGEEFHVTTATRFEHHSGGAASLASLHGRERVRVTHTGHQATNVHILSSYHHSRGNVNRHRASNYHPPHYHHHHRR